MDTVTKIFKVRPPAIYKSPLKPVDCSNPDLIMGLELETENASRDGDTYSVGLGKGWRVARDGSLRDTPTTRAYEFISNPMPLGTLLPELKAFFEYTKFDEENYSDRCSVHVHTNVTDFTQDMLASLAMVYTIVEDVLFKYVNHHGAKNEDGYSRDTNIYCIPWSQCRMNHRLIEKFFVPNTRDHLHQWQKYTALNLLPITEIGTVEWRHMHGTADLDKLTTWLNVIGSIMYYARRTPLDDVIKTVKTLNDTSAYRQFFTDVLKGHLAFDDAYQAPMAEGVINAKYSLFDWNKEKKAAQPAPVTFRVMDDLVDPAPLRPQDFLAARTTWDGATVGQVTRTPRPLRSAAQERTDRDRAARIQRDLERMAQQAGTDWAIGGRQPAPRPVVGTNLAAEVVTTQAVGNGGLTRREAFHNPVTDRWEMRDVNIDTEGTF